MQQDSGSVDFCPFERPQVTVAGRLACAECTWPAAVRDHHNNQGDTAGLSSTASVPWIP